MKSFCAILFWACLTAQGQEIPLTIPDPTPSPTPFILPSVNLSKSLTHFNPDEIGGVNPALSPQEQQGVQITKDWSQQKEDALITRPGESGNVTFRFGQSFPTIVCATTSLSDIALEPGEYISRYDCGDTVRWKISSCMSGPEGNQTQHLIIKPTDIGLRTTLIIMTNRRTYHLFLKSDSSEFMMAVNFVYPEAPPLTPASPAPTPLKAPRALDNQSVQADSSEGASNPPSDSPAPIPAPTTHAKPVKAVALRDSSAARETHEGDELDINYTVKGEAVWRPTDIYSKDGHTYIRIPPKARNIEAPVLFEQTRSGWFHHQQSIVNYRVKGQWFVVDHLFDKAVMVSGVGAQQKKVIIEHVKPAARKPPRLGYQVKNSSVHTGQPGVN